MLIQAYCQQEREKRCTITAKAAESNPQDADESGVGKMVSDDPTPDQTADGTKTPKIEPNESPTPNDVEMIDTTEPVTAIKQEPEDEVTSIETDPLADGDDEGGGGGGSGTGANDDGGSKDNSNANSRGGSVGGDEDSTNAIKSDAKSDSQPSENQAIKVESDENCNDSSSENNKEHPSESTTANTTNTDEPIKIEESTADKDDPFSKDINIDPRTYCKLGHFHLLLEDYAKGMYE